MKSQVLNRLCVLCAVELATCSMSTAMNEIQLNLARKWRAQYFDQIIGQDIVGQND